MILHMPGTITDIATSDNSTPPLDLMTLQLYTLTQKKELRTIYLHVSHQSRPHVLELDSVEGLGQDVGDLPVGRDVHQLHISALDTLSDEVVSDVNMFRPLVVDGVLAHRDGALVILVDLCRRILSEVQRFEELTGVHDVLRSR